MSTLEIPMSMQMVMDLRTKGKSWEHIAERFGKAADEIYAEYQQFMASRQTHTEAEYRMLQLNRLEALVDKMWDGIDLGSVDHAKVMLSVVKEISKLLDMHMEKTRIEVKVVEERQVSLVVDYVDAVAETLLRETLKTVTAKGARSQIEERWGEWVAQASAQPLKEIESAAVEV